MNTDYGSSIAHPRSSRVKTHPEVVTFLVVTFFFSLHFFFFLVNRRSDTDYING